MSELRKRKRWRWLALTLAGLFAMCGGAIYFPDSPDREMARLRRAIDAELPSGSSPAAVEKWLRDHDLDPLPPVVDSEGRLRRLSVIASREYFWQGGGELNLWFQFDQNGGLSEHGGDWFALSL